jgi:hypothetical protein
MINKGMEIAIKERLTADVLTSEINQRCKYRYSKYCRDGKEANMLFLLRFLKVLFMAKGLKQHMLLSISKAIPTGGMWPLFQ